MRPPDDWSFTQPRQGLRRDQPLPGHHAFPVEAFLLDGEPGQVGTLGHGDFQHLVALGSFVAVGRVVGNEHARHTEDQGADGAVAEALPEDRSRSIGRVVQLHPALAFALGSLWYPTAPPLLSPLT